MARSREGPSRRRLLIGTDTATIVELLRRGHKVDRKRGDTFGGYEGIWIDQQHGTRHGATEPRKDGAPVGY